MTIIKGFIIICCIVAGIYLLNLVSAISYLFHKKGTSKGRINPHKFFTRLFRNMDDGFGSDVKVAILPIVCTFMTLVGIGSILFFLVKLMLKA